MTPARAKEVLEGMTTELHHRSPWIKRLSVDNDNGKLNIDSTLLADELEAIACWMRDPKGVVNA